MLQKATGLGDRPVLTSAAMLFRHGERADADHRPANAALIRQREPQCKRADRDLHIGIELAAHAPILEIQVALPRAQFDLRQLQDLVAQVLGGQLRRVAQAQ